MFAGALGGAINADKEDVKRKQEATRRVVGWIEKALPPEEEDTAVMVNQLECKEEGCPPVECVIALLRKPRLTFKIYKQTVEVTEPEVVAALKKALAAERGEPVHEHSHIEKHAAGEHGHAHGHDEDCCGHEHGHSKPEDHDHGHSGTGGKCCEHGHEEPGHADHAHGHGHGHDHAALPPPPPPPPAAPAASGGPAEVAPYGIALEGPSLPGMAAGYVGLYGRVEGKECNGAPVWRHATNRLLWLARDAEGCWRCTIEESLKKPRFPSQIKLTDLTCTHPSSPTAMPWHFVHPSSKDWVAAGLKCRVAKDAEVEAAMEAAEALEVPPMLFFGGATLDGINAGFTGLYVRGQEYVSTAYGRGVQDRMVSYAVPRCCAAMLCCAAATHRRAHCAAPPRALRRTAARTATHRRGSQRAVRQWRRSLHLRPTSAPPPPHLRSTSAPPPLHLRSTSAPPPLHLAPPSWCPQSQVHDCATWRAVANPTLWIARSPDGTWVGQAEATLGARPCCMRLRDTSCALPCSKTDVAWQVPPTPAQRDTATATALPHSHRPARSRRPRQTHAPPPCPVASCRLR